MARIPTIQDPERFCREFVAAYLRPGLGRMPKRDIDVLVLHLLDLYSDVPENDWEAARKLGSSPTRVRGLRADAMYMLTDSDEQDALLHDAFFQALDDELLEPRSDGRVVVTLTDPFVRDGIRAICASEGKVADYTFNRNRLLLTHDGFRAVCRRLLTDEEREVIARCAADERWFPADTPFETMRRKLTDLQGRPDPKAIATLIRMALGDVKSVKGLMAG